MNITNPLLMTLMALWPIALILVFWSALSVYVFIKAPARYYLRFSLIPTMLVSSLLCVALLFVSLGYGVSMSLPPQFEYLGHNVVLDGSYKKVGIEVWVHGKRTRLYVIKYSKEAEKKLKEAQEKKKSGAPVIMKRGSGKEDKGGQDGMELDDYESNIMLPHEANPKIEESKPQTEGLPQEESPKENSRSNMI